MSASVADLLAAALKLGDNDRTELVERIWETLDPPESDDDLADEELEAEILRRRDEARRDPGVLIPWELVRTMP